MNFEESLAFGRVAEGEIARWFLNRGYTVLPIYEKEIAEGKGPKVFFPDAEIIGTDMLVFNGEKTYWVEAKHKNAFSFYRTGSTEDYQCWTTGIDRHHYEDYLKIADRTPWPVYLFFYHRGGQAKDSPPSPAGLFFENIIKLRRLLEDSLEHAHSSNRWGKTGMVYWCKDSLRQLPWPLKKSSQDETECPY